MAVSWDTERKLAEALAQKSDNPQDVTKFGPELAADDYRRREIEEIVQHLIRVAEEDFFEVRGRLHWTVRVRDNPIPNAFCSIGGSVTVFSGLFDMMTEAERNGTIKDARCALACILAHEIAHGLCRHGTEKISWLPLEYPLSFLMQDSTILQTLLAFIVNLPYSRLCETEADLVGVELMARAGFDPREAVKTFKLLDHTTEFLEFASTHPAGETRAKRVEEGLVQVISLYEKNQDRFFKKTSSIGTILDMLKRLIFPGRLHHKNTGRVPLSQI